MATVLKLGGVEGLLAELARLAPDLAAETVPLQTAIANQTADDLRAAYPVVTGALRSSVEVQREPSISPARVFTRVTVTSPYAGFFEFGTVRTAPQPTFRPAVRRGREEFLRAVIARVKSRGLLVTGEAGEDGG